MIQCYLVNNKSYNVDWISLRGRNRDVCVWHCYSSVVVAVVEFHLDYYYY